MGQHKRKAHEVPGDGLLATQGMLRQHTRQMGDALHAIKETLKELNEHWKGSYQLLYDMLKEREKPRMIVRKISDLSQDDLIDRARAIEREQNRRFSNEG